MAMNIKPEIEKLVEQVTYEAKSRAFRAANELRNSALNVLRGQRSGRVYKKPGTYGKRMTKQTKELLKDYGHNLRGGQLYRASAPGEPPAVRSGNLRQSWRPRTESENTGSGLTVRSAITTDVKYAPWLNDGTRDGRIAPRPFEEPIIERAKPHIRRIFKEPYR
ncbi:MAG: hypothetical protein M1571_04285 [Firmicutes bacterium]|nr:hypothetical protein [Bacillota bacterium]